jgi:hypothetical protein
MVPADVYNNCPFPLEAWTARVVAIGGHPLTAYEARTASFSASNGPCVTGNGAG